MNVEERLTKETTVLDKLSLAWAKGQSAFYMGDHVCPYPELTKATEAWWLGHKEAEKTISKGK